MSCQQTSPAEPLPQEMHPAPFSQAPMNGTAPSYPQKKDSNCNETDIPCLSRNIKSYAQKDENLHTQKESYPYSSK